MIILLHSSKTMRFVRDERVHLSRPLLLEKSQQLGTYLKTLSPQQLAQAMKLSPALSEKTHALIATWTTKPEQQSLAMDSFIGDIYSGLHANDLPADDRDYTNDTLRILSGLYGLIRPYDGIYPYRLEMGYRLPDPAFSNLYTYWGGSIAACLPAEGHVINLAAEEYSKTVTRFVDPARVWTPRFLTTNPKTGRPEFVVVHAKIARGAFARWLITERIQDVTEITQFAEIGYRFASDLSTADNPTFVCDIFQGKGLSIRLQ